jgi:alpha-L-fucosidase
MKDVNAVRRTLNDTIVTPTRAQQAWHDLELGMFIHFDLNTWMRPHWSHREYDEWPSPSVFNPTKLDTDQWLEAAQAMGAKYAVLTATHGTGFMLWQSDAYPYGVKQSPWRDGKGDVVGDFVTSCRKYGIQPGLYSHMCVNGYWRQDHPGRVNEGKGGDPEKQKAYATARTKALRELWGNYGPLFEIWFDGGDPGQDITEVDVVGLLQELQSDAVLFQGPDQLQNVIRWVGNERGEALYPNWSTAHEGSAEHGWTEKKLSGDPDGALWVPAECDVAIREHNWHWTPGTEDSLFSLEHLVGLYYRSVGRNSNLLLNVSPNRDGLIPAVDVQRLREFGHEIRRRFPADVASTHGHGDQVELGLDGSQPINHVVIMEEISHGERILEYVVEARTADGGWQNICTGESVGHKRIEQFEPVSTDRIRLRITKAKAEPRVRRLAAHYVAEEE